MLILAIVAVALARAHKLDPPEVLASIGGAIAVAGAAALLFVTACVTIWRTGAQGFGRALGGLFFAALTLGYPAFLAVEAMRYPSTRRRFDGYRRSARILTLQRGASGAGRLYAANPAAGDARGASRRLSRRAADRRRSRHGRGAGRGDENGGGARLAPRR